MGKIIALTGLAGSGKSTVANLLAPPDSTIYDDGGTQIGFADPLKRFCAEVFGFDRQQLYGPSSERERPSTRFTRPTGEPLTPRYALQTLGTEWGRNCDPDVWAKAGIDRAETILDMALDDGNGLWRVVITDLRFLNEARLVREAGGQVWRVRRPTSNAQLLHASEREVWCPEMSRYVTREIPNTGTLEHLAATVHAALADST